MSILHKPAAALEADNVRNRGEKALAANGDEAVALGMAQVLRAHADLSPLPDEPKIVAVSSEDFRARLAEYRAGFAKISRDVPEIIVVGVLGDYMVRQPRIRKFLLDLLAGTKTIDDVISETMRPAP